MITTIQFVCPRSVSAGELVMDPNSGSWGYAKTHYEGGKLGTFSAGSGYVVTVSGSVSDGADLWCRNGLMHAAPSAPDETPCASVISVMSQADGQTTALVRLY